VPKWLSILTLNKDIMRQIPLELAESMKQHYQTLELPANASPRRIKEQYRKLAKRYHPDRTSNPEKKAYFAEKFREITAAYEALADIIRRGNLPPPDRKLDFLYHQGRLLVEEKKWSQALAVFNEIIILDPAYKDVPTCLREARRRYKRLVSLYNTADGLFKDHKWAEATIGFGEVLRENPYYRDAARKFKRARRERLLQDFMNRY
jgi:curved DNA-binding protein CbpA